VRKYGKYEESSGDYKRIKNYEFRIMNTKKKIYMLHGWAYSIDRWKPFSELLKKSGFDPVVLKIPGLTAPIDREWLIDDYVSWLNEQLREEKEQITLLGHSNGGLIAMSYVLKHPGKVKKIILIDSTGIHHKDLVIRAKRMLFMIAAKIGKTIIKSPIAKKLLYKFARAHDYENATPIMKKTMINLINTDLTERFKEIDIPTIIIWGKKDEVTPITDGKFMERAIPNAKLYSIEDARHSPQLTHPEVTAKIISDNL
jgi:pimeloyl-ACP methyl ester carboxylesterase